MTDGWRAALSMLIVFFVVIGFGPFFDWLEEKIRSSIEVDKRSENYSHSKYTIPREEKKDG